MFAQLKGVLDLVVSGFNTVRDFNSKRDREEAVTQLLRFYFLLKDCVDEGNALILEAGSDPVSKIASLTPEAAAEIVSSWDAVLRRQPARLYALAGQLGSQDALAVLNPALIEEIQTAIGSKMDRAITLSGIGSALVIRCMFPLNESNPGMAHLVAMMAGERKDKINLRRIGREVDLLQSALDGYRDHVSALASKEEILKLSKKAREATEMTGLVGNRKKI